MTSKSILPAVLSVTALCLLSACNTTPQPGVDAGASGMSRPVGSASHAVFKLPEGTGCEGDAQRFRALVDHDLETGFVAKSVYNKAISEIAAAQKACASGEEAKARAMLSASKRRYGYPS